MKYGSFDDAAKEYVITTPQTPLPWINYLGNEDFFSLISNTAGGYSFYKDAKLLRITRYRYNNCPGDIGGRYYYIKEKETVWNPAWQPVQTQLDHYRCRHGLGYTVFESGKNGLDADLTCFVPLGYNCEVNKLVLTNRTNEVKTITLTSFVEFCLWNAADDASNFQRNFSIGEVEIDGSTIYHKTEYRERRNHYAVYSANCHVDGFETDRESFCGAYRGLHNPRAVFGNGANNSIASGWAPIGSHQIHLKILPNERKSVIFILGYIENSLDKKWESLGVVNKQPAKEMLSSFSSDEQVNKALVQLKSYWRDLLSHFHVESGDDKFDRMVNIWNQYQCMVTFNMSRSASYYESGMGRGMGFRDSCQDLLGFVHMIPHRARQRILDIAATQFPDGSAYHQYQPLTKRGNMDVGSGFNDDPIWLIAAVSAYLRETGDYSILDESVPFDNDDNEQASLFEHLKCSFNYTCTHKGPHLLPLIGRADWNDCLNLNCYSDTPGESFQTCANFESGKAESVFIAGLFVKYGKEYAELCRRLGKTDLAEQAEMEIASMTEAVLANGWDGDWFLRAYDAQCNPVGSHTCDEGKIYIESQGMCVMAGIGVQNGYAKKALKSVEKYLDSKYGVALLSPAYKEYHLELGEVSSYPPGYKENGSIFCHNNPWMSCAETVLGHGDRAFEVYRKICPAYIEDISEIHRTEPYVYSQTIAGPEAIRFGEAKNSWLTGTAAWTFTNVSQYLLGIRPQLDGLSIDPCIPSTMKYIKIQRLFRKAVYDITIDNRAGVQKGIKTIVVNGKTYQDSFIPYTPDINHYAVDVIMG